MMTTTILRLFRERGDAEYHGEAVSQLQHALQCADLAVREEAPDTLIAAALLHDIGHLLHEGEDIAAQAGLDRQHEILGEMFLAQHFGPEVVEPVRLHVAAKRYLCATDPAYLALLSPASQRSLELQGGAMTDAEVATFEANPHFPSAVRLRRWDDQAKDPTLIVPPVEKYMPLLNTLVSSSLS